MTDRNEDLKTEIFVGGQNNTINLEKVNKNLHQLLNAWVFDEKIDVIVHLKHEPQNIESSDLLRQRQIQGVKSQLGNGKAKIIRNIWIFKGGIIKTEMFVFKDLS